MSCRHGAITPDILDGHDVVGRVVLFSTGWDRPWRTDHYGHPGNRRCAACCRQSIVEHLARLEALVGATFRFFVVPPKVKGIGTFPVRAWVLLDLAS